MQNNNKMIKNKKNKNLFEQKSLKKFIDDSVDNVIDKFIIDYEDESLKIKKESFRYKNYILDSILMEAEADTNIEDTKASPGADESLRKNPDYQLDIAEFTKNVVRLHDNYESLIDIQDIILKRVYNFLQKHYSKDIIKEFEKFLKVNYELEIDKSSIDQEYDFVAPYSTRSGGGTQ